MAKLLLALLLLAQAPASDLNEALWEAARVGDAARIAALLEKGADVNAKARYDVTALIFAAGNGRMEAVKLLLARGADVNSQDTFYRGRALDMALSNGHSDVAIFLLQNGSRGGDGALRGGVQSNNLALVKAALAAPDLGRQTLQAVIALAEQQKWSELVPLLRAALEARPAEPAAPAFPVNPATLASYAGTYRDASTGVTMVVAVQDATLTVQSEGQAPSRLVATGEATFRLADNATVNVTFNSRGGLVESMTAGQANNTITLTRTTAAAAAPAASSAPPAPAAAARPVLSKPRNWPSFRGDGASGNGDGQGAVVEWDVKTGKNIKWKTPIPGIGNSSPIVWGNRVFVTTAISKGGDHSMRTGLYGDVKPVDDLSVHEWRLYCLDKTTGKILWERVAFAGTPRVKRHTKATQANSTPVTDGQHVVAAFGSIGLLVAWDANGKELWRADLGVLDSGWFFDPAFQWGHSSSPIIFGRSVILQADQQKGSYLAAWDLARGKQLWKTNRDDEISTWGTPTAVRTAAGRDEIVSNGTKIRGYDAITGKLLWTLRPNSEIAIATPVSGHGLVFVTGGYPPVRPVYAIRPGGSGDISLPSGSASSDTIAWSNATEGTYIPTPIVYGDHLYTLNINGIITAYEARTGQRAFRGRVGAGGAFSASPVAADGKLYVASEDGEIYVIGASQGFPELAKNVMNEVVMTTPAISGGLIIIRTLGHLYGIGE